MHADTTRLARIAAAGWLALAALGHAAGLPNVEPKLLPPERRRASPDQHVIGRQQIENSVDILAVDGVRPCGVERVDFGV